MKRVLKAALTMLAAGCLVEDTLAVATFVFSNFGLAPVYDSEGELVFGDQYVAMLYGGVTIETLKPARTVGGHLVAPVHFFLPGTFLRADGGVVYLDSEFDCDGRSWLQVRVWDTRLGSTYEAVAALGIGGYGESTVWIQSGGDPCPTPTPATRLVGMESFSLRPLLHLESPGVDAESFHFAVHGPAGMEVVVEQSTNLVDWVDWQSLTLGEVPTQLSDTNAPNYLQTFYRARKAP